MNKSIVIINGSGGVGKDTFVRLAAKHAKVMNFSSVDRVKEAAMVLGWRGGKTERDRKFLSDLKDLSSAYNDYPMQSMRERVSAFYNSNAEILFLHIREPEEIERAKKEFNAKTLLIGRKSVDLITTNHADASVFDYRYDYEISNDGDFVELETKAVGFIETLRD